MNPKEFFNRLFISKDIDPPERLAARLNSELERGRSIVQVSEMLAKVHNPILVDFNNVLANNREPVVPNPDAFEFLTTLRSIGTVIILTTSSAWSGIHTFLQKESLWSERDILITGNNYMDACARPVAEDSRLAQLYIQYNQIALANGLLTNRQIEEVQKSPFSIWGGSLADKRVAFAFLRPHQIPLIDDFKPATSSDNPGVFGIHVRPWSNDSEDLEEIHALFGGASLQDAVDHVSALYSQASQIK